MTDVSAILVTRGNVDLQAIVDSLPFDDIVIWDNSKQDDLKVYGRYHAASLARHPIVYVQDDDCIVGSERIDLLLDEYEEGKVVVGMSPEHEPENYTDHCLVGWGALFRADMAERAFRRYLNVYPLDDDFKMCCDVIFTALTPFKRVAIEHDDLPWATSRSRMYRQPGHAAGRKMILERARGLRQQLDPRVQIGVPPEHER